MGRLIMLILQYYQSRYEHQAQPMRYVQPMSALPSYGHIQKVRRHFR
jgi:hypothetical protein